MNAFPQVDDVELYNWDKDSKHAERKGQKTNSGMSDLLHPNRW